MYSKYDVARRTEQGVYNKIQPSRGPAGGWLLHQGGGTTQPIAHPTPSIRR